jgi:hypothetical protein
MGVLSHRQTSRCPCSLYSLSCTLFRSMYCTVVQDPLTHNLPLFLSYLYRRGIQDGMHVHQSTQLLLYCDGTGAWVWSLPLARALGIIKVPCTQLQFSQNDGVGTIYILAQKQLFTTQLNFDGATNVPAASPVCSIAEEGCLSNKDCCVDSSLDSSLALYCNKNSLCKKCKEIGHSCTQQTECCGKCKRVKGSGKKACQ